MAAAFFNVDPRKKSTLDGTEGMSADTRRHFERVKRKMFAFVDQQHRMKLDRNHQASPIVFRRHPQQLSADQNKERKAQPRHHRTPEQADKQFQIQDAVRRQLPHLALATPQVARRVKK